MPAPAPPPGPQQHPCADRVWVPGYRAEISKIQNWRARIDGEVSAQLKFASDWGTLLAEPPAATLDEEIERKRAELAR